MAGLNFTPTYQDYLNNFNPYADGSGDLKPMGESAFNGLSDADKMQNIGYSTMAGSLGIGPGDPRFQGLFSQLARPGVDDPNRGIEISNGSPDSNAFVDPSKVAGGPGLFAYLPQNITPQRQAQGHEISPIGKAMLALVGGIMGYGAYSAFAGAGGTAAAAPAATGTSTGVAPVGTLGSGTTLTGTGLDTMGTGALGSGANLTGTGLVSGTGASLAGTAVPDATVGSGLLGGLSTGGVASTALQSSPGFLSNLMSGNVGDAASSAGSWALSHPLQTAGLLQTAAGLVHRNGSSSSSTGDKSGGGSGLGSSSLTIPQVNYVPNPYLAAQIQRGYS